jgi:hypothetical protein
MFGFPAEPFFEIEEGDRATLEEAPRVDFGGTAAPAGPTPPAGSPPAGTPPSGENPPAAG